MSLVELHNLSKTYPGQNGATLYAVSDVSLTINTGEVLGVVGESGCGKSTLGRALLRLVEPTGGKVSFDETDIIGLSAGRMKSVRKDMQVIFQDPFGSLNPRHTVGGIIGEPLAVHNVGSRNERKKRVAELLQMVGLPDNAGDRYPHEFSGGQRQRIAIARAMALNPKFLVADEAVSALDVSVQSQIINLIAELQQRLKLSMLFISHDLSVIRHVSDRIAVMYLGRIVETGPTEALMSAPKHPYTKALLSAIPKVGVERQAREVLNGELPDPANPPQGCAFSARCPKVMELCKSVRPELSSTGKQYEVACHLHQAS